MLPSPLALWAHICSVSPVMSSSPSTSHSWPGLFTEPCTWGCPVTPGAQQWRARETDDGSERQHFSEPGKAGRGQYSSELGPYSPGSCPYPASTLGLNFQHCLIRLHDSILFLQWGQRQTAFRDLGDSAGYIAQPKCNPCTHLRMGSKCSW